ncbi:hypothetical protein [Rhizobium phage RHEph12]|nr:hypothetical protein [Rhizobium phage RHEph12]
MNIDFTKIIAMFDAAKASGLKQPKFRFQNGIVISTAPATGRNPGALYVTNGNANFNDYMGMIASGEFRAARNRHIKPEEFETIAAVAADPKAAAIAYGRETGRCCMCGIELTNAVSIRLGIGPICGGRVGFFTAEEVDAYESGETETAVEKQEKVEEPLTAAWDRGVERAREPVAAPVVEVEDGLTKIPLSQAEIEHLVDLLSLQSGWNELYAKLNKALI